MLRYLAFASMVLLGLAAPSASMAQAPTNSPWGPIFRTIAQLPDGPLYWRLQTFETREAAEAAVGPTGQVGEAEGLVWLFTLGRQGERGVDNALAPVALRRRAQLVCRQRRPVGWSSGHDHVPGEPPCRSLRVVVETT